jgi:hypothetical protein
MYDTGLADRLRDAGLIVEEVAGWQDRGHGDLAGPTRWLWHHTAGGPGGRAPSLGTCLNGVPGVPGPLVQLLQTRETPPEPDHVMVLAAGYAYHAGRGGFRGERRDYACLGLEIEHTGVVPLPDYRREISLRIAAAAFGPYGDAEACCQHSEWSEPPGSKIDVATEVDPDEWRALVRAVMEGEEALKLDDEDRRWLEGTVDRLVREHVGVGMRQLANTLVGEDHSPARLAEWSNDERRELKDQAIKTREQNTEEEKRTRDALKAEADRVIAALDSKLDRLQGDGE